jgi:hypothetical protein
VTAFQTIQTGLGAMQSGGTLWLLDGTYDTDSGEPMPAPAASLTVPDGVAVRAENTGSVTIGSVGKAPPGLTFEGSGSLRGVAFDGVAVAITASGGTIDLTDVHFANSGGGCNTGNLSTMVLSGTAHVTLAPGATAEYAGAGSNVRGVARLSESAELNVDGGTFTELANAGCSPSTAFGVDDSAKLLLDTVTFVDTPAQNRWGTVTVHDEGSVTILDSTFDGGAAPAVVADGPGTQIVNIQRTTIRDLTGAAILLGRERAPGTPELTITNGVLTGNVHGIGVTTGGVGGINLTVPDISITESAFRGNTGAGIELNNGGSLSITG